MYLVPLNVETARRLWQDIADTLDAYPSLWEVATKESIFEGIEEGAFQLWVLGAETEARCFFLTSVIQHPARRTFQVSLAIGEGVLDNWELVQRTLFEAAAAAGADEVEIIAARGGMARVFQSAGFKIREISLVAPVVGAAQVRH